MRVWNAICFKYKEVQIVYSGHETRRQFRRSRTPSSSKGFMPESLVNSEWGKKGGGGRVVLASLRYPLSIVS